MNAKNRVIAGCAATIFCEVLYGLSYLFTKQATETASAVYLLSWRFILAFIVINICIIAGIAKIDLKGKDLRPLFALAIFTPVLYFIGETIGISLTTASESGTFLACIPVVSLICSTLILKIKPTKFQVIGVAITLFGVLVTVFAQGMSVSFSPVGYLMLFIAVTTYSLYAVLSEKAEEFSSVEKTYIMILLGMIFYTAVALVQSIRVGEVAHFITLPFTDRFFLIAIIYLGLGCSVLVFLFYNVAIDLIGTNRAVTFIGISTLVSIVAGVIFLHESFTVYQVVGAVFIIGGVYVANLMGGGSEE